MKTKNQTTYDLSSDQFIHLKRRDSVLHRVDINDLNKRLNETRKSNFYTTTFNVLFSTCCLIILTYIGFKF